MKLYVIRHGETNMSKNEIIATEAELETMNSVYERIYDFLNELKSSNSDDNILLVTHGGISRAIYWYFNGIPENGNSSNINENCKIYDYEL